MFSSPFLPLPAGLKIATTTLRNDLLVVQVVSTKMKSCCPLCFCLAQRRHSQYTRVVADLPCAGFRIQLILHVRRFFCDHADCIRKIFTERLPAFVLPWARLTVRLCEALQSLGLATCGELGTRLAARLAIQTSPTTILRRLMILPLDPVKSVIHLGIDDFALRCVKIYGTVLVDLQRHQVIDLLPDRKAETARVWIQKHQEIKVVSRDRAGDYATAARQGAPQALEAADRFHLVKNLAEAVEKALVSCRAELRKGPKTKEATWLFIRHFADLKEKEREELAALRQASARAETIYQLVQAFLQMVRTLQGEHLESWLRSVRACHIPELHSFANGVERDKAAVLNGLTLSHSNGQTEGQVTRIKLIKRMMYGRAGFALLRQRVLHRF